VAQSLIVAWTGLVLVSTAGGGYYARRLKRSGESSGGAIWLSMLAVVPGACFLAEWGARSFGASLDGHPMIPVHQFVTIWPGLLGTVIGFLLLVSSYVSLPIRQGSVTLEACRIAHLLAWGLSVVAFAGAVASL
jgi:hypothetical protein